MATCRSVFSTFAVDPMIKLGSLGLCGRCFKKNKNILFTCSATYAVLKYLEVLRKTKF